MKIQNLTPQTQNTQFKSNAYVKQLTRPIANTKVCKNLTELDKNSFHTYMIARRFPLITTEKEIKELFNFQGEEFLTKAFDFLTEKLNINKNFLPYIQKSEPNALVPFSYIAKNNIITVPNNIENCSNIYIFTALRHELQHYQQNLIMLRDDKIGEKLPTVYADMIVEDMQNNAISLLEKSSYEELSKKYSLTPEQAEFYKTCDYYIKNDDVDGFIEIFEPAREIYKNNWENFRYNLLKEYGPLLPTQKERAQAYFNDFFNIEYYNKDGSINRAKHLTTGIEFEANVAAEYAIHQIFNKSCYFKTIKDSALQLINTNDNDSKQLLDDIVEEVIKKTDKNK